MEFNRFLVGDGKLLGSQEYDRIDIEDAPIDSWGYGGHKTNTEEEIQIKKIKHCNAFLSHQAMAKKALEDGDEKVLFLEDDSYFTERFDEVVKKAEPEIEKINYDMLYLGWWLGDEGDEFNNDIEKIWEESKSIGIGKATRIGGLHGVIISRKILDIITRLEPINPIDSQLSRFFHDKIESSFLAPKIIHDKGIFSECEQSTITRLKL